MKKRTVRIAVLSSFLLGLGVLTASAQSPARSEASPSWMERWFGGPGMMGGAGPGMMGGYGPRYGTGSGQGCGGMGAMMGMMGIGGHGMMGMGPYYMLDLSEQQRAKIGQIQDEVRRKNWDVVGRLLDEQARLRDLYAAEKRDPAAIGRQSMKIAELRRQLVEASVDAHNRIEAVLGKEQKERVRRYGPAWMMGED